MLQHRQAQHDVQGSLGLITQNVEQLALDGGHALQVPDFLCEGEIDDERAAEAIQ